MRCPRSQKTKVEIESTDPEIRIKEFTMMQDTGVEEVWEEVSRDMIILSSDIIAIPPPLPWEKEATPAEMSADKPN